ncbi:helix-turn-helix domain-containing protein [Streptomyces nitrosporeus]|uniref:helix-turn-helix domain-containing protein n=1 Tax=Streptomyces nitrosporeus TaxID=28894 RepID=UPI00332E73D3
MHSNDHLPASERFDWYRELVGGSFLSSVVSSEETDDFRASATHLDLGVTQMGVLEYPSLRARRPPGMVRDEDADTYWLFMNTRGRQVLSGGRDDSALGPGQMVLLNAGRPFDARALPSAEGTQTLFVAFARETVPLSRRLLDHLTSARFDAGPEEGSAMASLLGSFMRRLAADPPPCGPQDAVRLGAVLMDLTVAMLAHHGDQERTVPPENRRTPLLYSSHAFIDRHLASRDLSPETVAAAHHISVRHLHRIFREQGVTVSAWIRHRRLERCRRDLVDPACARLTVQAVGARWGFTHASELSRAFSAAYGVPPGEYRRRAAGGARRGGGAAGG